MRNLLPYLFIIIPVALLIGLGIFPLVYAVWMSLHWWPMAPYRPITFVGGGNYVEFVTARHFWEYIRITLTYTGLCLGLQFFIGLGLALLTRSGGKLISPMRVLFTIPILMAPVAAGLIWRFLLNELYGPLYILMRDFGILIRWNDPTPALFWVIIADTWQWMPFMFLVLLSGIYSIPKSLYEAAAIDGASGWQEIRYIILPNLKRITLVLLLLRGSLVFAELDKIYVITGGGPGRATMTLAYAAFQSAFQAWELGMAAAICFIIVIIVNILFVAFMRLLREKR